MKRSILNHFLSLSIIIAGVFLVTGAANAAPMPYGTGLYEGDIETVLGNFLVWMLGIVGILMLIAFIVSGIMYLVSFGSDDMTKKAKSAMTASFIGVVVVLGAYVVVAAINNFFSGY